MKHWRLWWIPLLVALVACGGIAQAAEEVNVYSARKERLIKPLLERFSAQTGIRVNLVTGKADTLLERLRREGRNSPADLFITVDAGRLHRAREAGVLQPARSPVLSAAVPENYRDPQGYWYALSVRARPILYARGRVDPATLSTYEALAEPRWRGRICVRSSNNIYNQSLVASMIASIGLEATQTWARGLVNNLARPPRGGDRDQIQAVAAGQCDLCLANTYYLGIMLNGKDPKQRVAAEQVAIFWPNQDGRGVHVNVSGAGLARHAPHREQALRLLEYLVGDDAQQWYAQVNYEYPVRPGVPISETLQAWGPFKADSINLSRLGELNAEAVRLMDRAGWK